MIVPPGSPSPPSTWSRPGRKVLDDEDDRLGREDADTKEDIGQGCQGDQERRRRGRNKVSWFSSWIRPSFSSVLKTLGFFCLSIRKSGDFQRGEKKILKHSEWKKSKVFFFIWCLSLFFLSLTEWETTKGIHTPVETLSQRVKGGRRWNKCFQGGGCKQVVRYKFTMQQQQLGTSFIFQKLALWNTYIFLSLYPHHYFPVPSSRLPEFRGGVVVQCQGSCFALTHKIFPYLTTAVRIITIKKGERERDWIVSRVIRLHHHDSYMTLSAPPHKLQFCVCLPQHHDVQLLLLLLETWK